MSKIDIDKNKKKFIDLYNKYITPNYLGADMLLKWIESTDFFTAPCSTRYHLACEGGLCDHSIRVAECLKDLIHTYYGNIEEDTTAQDAIDGDIVSIMFVGLLHDLCKCDMYAPAVFNEKEYTELGNQSDALGKYRWVSRTRYKVQPKFYFGHGSKSVFIIQNFIQGISLTEAQAIRYHQGGREDITSNCCEANITEVYNSNPLAFWLHTADMIATYHYERNDEFN